MNRVGLDFYNNTADIYFDGIQHAFESAQSFVSKTEFNFPNLKIMAIEIERGIFVVERAGGAVESGRDQPEIDWVLNNIDSIKSIARIEIQERAVLETPTWDGVRSMSLYSTDWAVIRHRDQVELQINTSLTVEQYQQLLQYRQQLRDAIPDSELPSPPGFLAVEGS